jgi:hypothetical protein
VFDPAGERKEVLLDPLLRLLLERLNQDPSPARRILAEANEPNRVRVELYMRVELAEGFGGSVLS